MQNKLIILCSLLLIFQACSKENDENLIQEELFIDSLLIPYFDSFVAEGVSRGVEIDLATAQIEGYLEKYRRQQYSGPMPA